MVYMKIDRQFIEIPLGIVLADPYFDQNGPVDMLIGAGIFFWLHRLDETKETFC